MDSLDEMLAELLEIRIKIKLHNTRVKQLTSQIIELAENPNGVAGDVEYTVVPMSKKAVINRVKVDEAVENGLIPRDIYEEITSMDVDEEKFWAAYDMGMFGDDVIQAVCGERERAPQVRVKERKS